MQLDQLRSSNDSIVEVARSDSLDRRPEIQSVQQRSNESHRRKTARKGSTR